MKGYSDRELQEFKQRFVWPRRFARWGGLALLPFVALVVVLLYQSDIASQFGGSFFLGILIPFGLYAIAYHFVVWRCPACRRNPGNPQLKFCQMCGTHLVD